MTESADLQISAFADDELSRDECEFLVRRLSRDSEARRQLLRYTVIGASMRGELLSPDPDVLRRRISAALEGVHLPVRADTQDGAQATPWLRLLTRPAVGAGIAATVAVAAVLVVSSGSRDAQQTEPTAAVMESVPSSVAVESELASGYIVPVSAGSQPYITLTDYIVQHNQFTPAIRRASINSSVVGEQTSWRVAPPAPAPSAE
ncbi:MAG TPA: sigma-E factor negative regulatory protein [Gammaproteobacteria bacterium]|nr:sigma-E factor negative regulatory protein [Gammaproteobacteria bacterium]